jgi:hypothetical protein
MGRRGQDVLVSIPQSAVDGTAAAWRYNLSERDVAGR